MFGSRFWGLRGRQLNLAISSLGSLDFLYAAPPPHPAGLLRTKLTRDVKSLFGYDQGVTGGLLDLPSFTKYFPEINPLEQDITGAEKSTRETNQGIAVASYNLGCFLGAIICIFIGNPLGRRRTIMTGCTIMTIGAIIMSSSYQLEQFIVGRIITGIGNGINTSTVPTWQSESAKSHDRGKLVMIEGSLITGGICTSYWINYG